MASLAISVIHIDMPNLFVFRVTPVNLSNLGQFCFMLSKIHNAVDPCVPKIIHDMIMTVDVSPFIRSLAPTDTAKNIRQIPWHDRPDLISVLDNKIEEIEAQDTVQTLGTYFVEQVNFLKSRYGSRIMTISCSYNKRDIYQQVLEYLALVHIVKLKANVITPSVLDHDIISKGTNVIDHFKNAFEQQNLVPKQLAVCGDYDIPIEDFFHRQTFFSHLQNLNALISTPVQTYYDTWYSNYQKLYLEHI